MKIRIAVTILLQFWFYSVIQAQENIRIDPRGDLIIIMYDLKASDKAPDFKVELYGSHNNFTSPIVQVSGDVGPAVKPGPNKIISWASKAELKDFKGELIFEFAITPNVPAPVQTPVILQQTPETKPEEVSINTDRPDDYLDILKQGKSISRIAMVTGVVTAGMGFYFKSAADKYYKQYQSAGSSANDLRDKVEINDQLYPIAMGVGGLSLLTSLYFAIKLQKQKHNWGLSVIPIKSGFQVAYQYKF